MENLPRVCAKAPIKVDLEKDKKYFWCSCGLSEKQPFCDGTHKKCEGFKSVAFTPEKDGPVRLCMCKQTKRAPFCDGSHNAL